MAGSRRIMPGSLPTASPRALRACSGTPVCLPVATVPWPRIWFKLTFIAAAEHWPTVRGLCQAQRVSWLRTTAGNLAVSAFRRNQAFRGRLPLLEARYRPPPADTHAQAMQAIALERWWQIVQGLPPQQHAVAAMRWLLGMNNCQIAARLGIADGTVAAHVSAVRGKLTAGMGPYDPFGSDEEGPSS